MKKLSERKTSWQKDKLKGRRLVGRERVVKATYSKHNPNSQHCLIWSLYLWEHTYSGSPMICQLHSCYLNFKWTGRRCCKPSSFFSLGKENPSILNPVISSYLHLHSQTLRPYNMIKHKASYREMGSPNLGRRELSLWFSDIPFCSLSILNLELELLSGFAKRQNVLKVPR